MLDGPGLKPVKASEAYLRLHERLDVLSRAGSSLGLERVYQLLGALGHPERAVPMVHVAGSNGKGSTSAFLATILAKSGRRVGLFTSPHLIRLKERIQFLTDSEGPQPLTDEAFVRAAQLLEQVAPGFSTATFFEVMTLLALISFRQANVDIAVIEAGLGARLDATRLVEAQVAVLTDLSLEHTEILGNTIEDIAREEGAVVRVGCPLIMADGPSVAMKVVDELAKAAGASVSRLGRDFDLVAYPDGLFDFHLRDRSLEGVNLSLVGEHQGRNAALALNAALTIDPHISDNVLRAGVESTSWPGRMECIRQSGYPWVLLDGAHNPHASRIFARALSMDSFSGPKYFVFGVLKDKNVAEMVEALAPRATSFYLTRPSSARARAPQEIAQLLQDVAGFTGRIDVSSSPLISLVRALKQAQAEGGGVVVCGSLYLVGYIRAQLIGENGQPMLHAVLGAAQ